MRREYLKEIIDNVVAKKLAEAKGNAPVYGYVIADKKSDNPRLQLVGYGNMPKSSWKKKILDDLAALSKYVEHEDWRSAAHLIEKNGVLYSMINMMKEVLEKPLEEIDISSLGGTQSTDAAKDAVNTSPAILEKQRQLMAEKEKLKKLTDITKEVDASVQERMGALLRKKEAAVKKQGPILDKIKRLENELKRKA